MLTQEKPSLEKSVKGSKLLGPGTSSSVTETTSYVLAVNFYKVKAME